MGAKILWSLVSGRESWSKKVIMKKYFPGSRLRCLDKPVHCKKGSPIFNLCIKAKEHFTNLLYWIPGNGKKINLWEDSILGDQPLGQLSEIRNIKGWLQLRNKETLWDISSWEEEGDQNWKDWSLGNVPMDLKNEADLLTQLLQGKSPMTESSKDMRGWGQLSGCYTVAEGYRSMQTTHYAAPNPAKWNFIWTFPFIPKIDHFCWTAAHNSILTGDNLKRRGMEGPSRCPLCRSEEETVNHLLLTCPYTMEVWKLVLNPSHVNINIPGNLTDLFSNWIRNSPFDLHKKPPQVNLDVDSQSNLLEYLALAKQTHFQR